MATLRSKNWDRRESGVGELARSEKAVFDKKESLWTSFRFITDFYNNCKIGSTGRPNGFELSKKEKREVKLANNVGSRVTGLPKGVFQTLGALFGAGHAAQPAFLIASGPQHEGGRHLQLEH
ncbi:hypothetical protein PC129_g7118 [Phytophthora cactorum]|uniref:Uncharacterized protein n=1 Tax=Phytophthora cactorum TaxID=29920 RepID=A0A8T1A0L2_9STRA|nr:hypothetical protein Pcac1_g978 [Phytophthora cactorum]KAG2795804.1 hypothetical protein PC111_g21986 [Phytophthora cactorum]KAG2846536.1 hypothetical protein PC112_g1390 [Phytophthora cactorum]KAG2868809.1 hypothetical protein PC113_g681 [Phytophthora cactorum]KAG2898174.1 hypothetical protein PC114_g14386 [Phytophthora cactorum]